ncbi:hypothetical protein SKAU_G00279010 [Synaphobranchus kaupii]|uniref:DUF5641 domain-containing protein n=1 Tax=Synaphobranchus kaupii TaxID=118154 RepID=A0A9Q1EWS2_SYNKA|nr:hypothetical protein SKAU_G00279010 [Synaphobranchus kaupii]
MYSILVTPNPHSVTTPVRLVWNSSQQFNKVSMNDLLLKGPDVLNPIRAVLLRFRMGEYAALGDIRKMYNSVWLKEREVHLHRFLWRDTPEEKIGEYAITRVNIGDRLAGCIAQLAMRETARLTQFAHMKEERRILEEDSYVDDILTSHNDPKRLDELTEGVEEILNAGGFSLKPWVRSGQSGRKGTAKQIHTGRDKEPEHKTLVLPNQLRDVENKALGIGYQVDQDQLYVMTSINFSRRKKKMRVGLNLLEEEVRKGTPDPLTRRELLSQIAGLYDPIGLVTPAKQKGTILVRRAFQEAERGSLTKETWDSPLSVNLREDAIKLFEEYVRLSQVKFHRSLTPSGWRGKPWGVTFSDGSDDAYGAVMYLRWETQRGVEVRLVESKAKLTPLDQKGDVVKAEMCGAVFAARLRGYLEKHGRLEVKHWFHFVDSQTVLGAIQRESYRYQTFFANRVGEIQKAGPVTDWWWIPGPLNIADIVTRGATPEDLGEDSEWQKGPGFLARQMEKWPMKSAAEGAAGAREDVSKLQRKAFSAVLTRAQSKKTPIPDDTGGKGAVAEKSLVKVGGLPETTKREEVSVLMERRPEGRLRGKAIVNLVRPERFSGLARLCGVVAWVRRAAERWLTTRSRAAGQAKWEARDLGERAGKPVLTVRELKTALQDLFLATQEGEVFPGTTLDRLVVSKDEVSGLLLCRGRVQTLEGRESGVPLVPYKAWLGTLLAREALRANHEGLAGTLLRMRLKAWVVQGRRVAKRTVDTCIMSQGEGEDVPAVRDLVKRRSKLKVWGVVFCCMASQAMHADIVEDLPALRELYEFLSRLDQQEVERKAASDGTEWVWILHPADSPHRNGAAEAADHVLKRALGNVGGGGCLTGLEFQTLLYQVANLSNERPINARAQAQEEAVEVVTPNSLLLGRAGPRGDSRGFEFSTYPYKRLRAIQVEVDRFWRQWSQLAGPNLFTRPKWHRMARNVVVGDLVWLADKNALRGQFRLGRVESMAPDKKGVVWDVRVRTCPGCPAPLGGPGEPGRRSTGRMPTTILHRDVRRVVVLLPVEEQEGPVDQGEARRVSPPRAGPSTGTESLGEFREGAPGEIWGPQSPGQKD